ncbi:MAG: YitT family protein, partial [Bacteroidetes bacterium]|nr:YitT family protein [Bacteroidota bacterium]
LYSILTYLSASKTVDFVIEGVDEYTGITVISAHSEEIRLMVIEKLGRGVTIYNGKRGFGKRGNTTNPIDIIYTVITRLEIAKFKVEVDKIDPNAFIIMSTIKDTKGGMIKKRPLH